MFMGVFMASTWVHNKHRWLTCFVCSSTSLFIFALLSQFDSDVRFANRTKMKFRGARMIVLVFFLATFIEVANAQSSQELAGTFDGLSPKEKIFWTRVTLRALHRLMDYAWQNVHQINLDGGVGIGMTEGQFLVLLKHNRTTPTDLKEEIQNLAVFGRKIVDRATPFMNSSSPDYFEILAPLLIKGLFEHDYDSRVTNANLAYPNFKNRKEYSQIFSNKCLSQVMGTWQNKGRPCSISEDCFNTMTAPNYYSYFLTHQVLFFLVGETMNCGEQLETIGKRLCQRRGRCNSLLELQEIMCASIVDEMKRMDDYNFLGNSGDLFLEQVMFCGLWGFKDVCTPRWLQLMLAWQRPNGCYVNTNNRPAPVMKRYQKRVDVLMDDGCSAHKTSVAAGALAICIRFLVEDIDPRHVPVQVNPYKLASEHTVNRIPAEFSAENPIRQSAFLKPTVFLVSSCVLGFALLMRVVSDKMKLKQFV